MWRAAEFWVAVAFLVFVGILDEQLDEIAAEGSSQRDTIFALVKAAIAKGRVAALIDAERMSYDFERVEEMVRAAHVAGIAVVARPWLNEPGLILRYFDCGVDGVMVPHIEDGADAKKFVDYVRYARPKDHADKIIIIMAETPNAIAHIDEIVAVPGIDVVNLGVNDIAFAAGHPGEPEHPEGGHGSRLRGTAQTPKRKHG